MASSSRTEVPVFNSSQDELIYWKKRSKQLEEVIHRMKSKRCWNCDNYEENMEKDPVKKARFDDHNEMDPFKIFPQHCQEIILKHLKKMDVYNMTKVSSYWKLVVESDKSAAAKLKKALTIKADGAEDIIKLLKDDVSYKYAMLSVESIDFACMSKFSSTLENLSFEQSHVSFRDYSCAIQNINFSRLLRLDLIFVDTSMLAWFAECTFPMLKHFQLTFSLRNVDDQEEENELINEIAYGFDGVLQNTLEKLPTLEHFVLISEIGYEFWDSESEPLHASPLLKTLQIPEFNEESITSLPLLEELTICNSLTANEFLRLAHKNLNLKKVTCRYAHRKANSLMAAYEDEKQAQINNDNFNKNIQIILIKL